MKQKIDLQQFALVDETSESQSVSYEAVGNKEDYSPIITNIDPELNFFLSRLGTAADATETNFNWLTEGLRPPQKNAHLEMEDYTTQRVGSVERRSNNIQYFKSTGRVSDTQRQTAKYYTTQDEFARQKEIAFKQHARDLEYAIVANDRRVAGDDTTPAEMGGIPYFMQEEHVAVTFDDTTSTATVSGHKLTTGDFVYFKTGGAAGDALPTELTPHVPYYIRKIDDDTFSIFDDLESAIENQNAITLSSDGTGTLYIVKNNIVDANNQLFTEDMINDAMEMAFRRGGNPTLAVMSGRSKRRFSTVITGGATKMIQAGSREITVVTDVFASDFGNITAEIHRMYPDKRIDLMDMTMWDLKWFNRPHEVQGLPKKGSYEEFVLESAFGLQGTQPKASASIINCKRPTA